MLPLHLGHGCLNALGLTYVHGDAARLAARRADLSRRCLDALELAAREHDVCAERGEEVCDAAADPAASARDESDLPVEEPVAKRGLIGHGDRPGSGGVAERPGSGGIGSGSRRSYSASASAGASAGGATERASASWTG